MVVQGVFAYGGHAPCAGALETKRFPLSSSLGRSRQRQDPPATFSHPRRLRGKGYKSAAGALLGADASCHFPGEKLAAYLRGRRLSLVREERTPRCSTAVFSTWPRTLLSLRAQPSDDLIYTYRRSRRTDYLRRAPRRPVRPLRRLLWQADLG
ncbi:Hypothetical predicted protein [Cloeon dipterum]|uniref:Uncharacterized protein n=1 Tax=Cloeon dipterum TaxID=197152 RepID=A0A8S1E2F7_9INSE|nr:Hypothetical predicted protein [Cloeon dipterum]